MTIASEPKLAATLDTRVALLAERQCGAFSRMQALAIGATDPTMQRRVRMGRWSRPYPGVYVVAGAPPSWRQEVWCAYLAAGTDAVVSHETALRLHEIDLVPPRPITLTVAHGGHARLPGVFVHQIDDLRRHRVSMVAGLPVSVVERVAVELAATLRPRHLSRVVDELVSTKRTTNARIAACLYEVARPGKPGVAKLAEVLDTRGDGYVPPQSELERALFAALAAGGLPEPRRQFPLPGRGAITGVVDAAYVEPKLIVEADGRRWHQRVDALKRDRLRDAEAARVGWLTLRFVYEQIVYDPAEVCATVADVMASRHPTPTQRPMSRQ